MQPEHNRRGLPKMVCLCHITCPVLWMVSRSASRSEVQLRRGKYAEAAANAKGTLFHTLLWEVSSWLPIVNLGKPRKKLLRLRCRHWISAR